MAEGKTPKPVTGRLLAWSPAQQKAVWSINFPTYLNGGVLATGGDVVFQGSIDGSFKAYAAESGKTLWSFDGRAPILAPPISYTVNGQQYVTVLTGLGMAYPINAALLLGNLAEKYGIDPRSAPRRVLTFAIGGKAKLPPTHAAPPPADDSDFKENPATTMTGAIAFAAHCSICHGSLAVGSGHAPDLRRSPIPSSPESFASVVKDGALVPRGMPSFAEFTPEKLENLRQYIRSRAAQLRQGTTATARLPSRRRDHSEKRKKERVVIGYALVGSNRIPEAVAYYEALLSLVGAQKVTDPIKGGRIWIVSPDKTDVRRHIAVQRSGGNDWQWVHGGLPGGLTGYGRSVLRKGSRTRRDGRRTSRVSRRPADILWRLFPGLGRQQALRLSDGGGLGGRLMSLRKMRG
jgi:mono/diheme cytochrome c family protein